MDRFNFNRFNRLFDELFSKNDFLDINQFLNDKNFEREVYSSDDGSYNVVYLRNGKKKERNELQNLKERLELAVENQDFELAVELRDKIKNLEQNHEEIKKLDEQLRVSIQNQDFEKCIEIRDKIKSLK